MTVENADILTMLNPGAGSTLVGRRWTSVDDRAVYGPHTMRPADCPAPAGDVALLVIASPPVSGRTHLWFWHPPGGRYHSPHIDYLTGGAGVTFDPAGQYAPHPSDDTEETTMDTNELEARDG